MATEKTEYEQLVDDIASTASRLRNTPDNDEVYALQDRIAKLEDETERHAAYAHYFFQFDTSK